MSSCQKILARGPRKGEVCGKKATKDSEFCSAHREKTEGEPKKRSKSGPVDRGLPKPQLYGTPILLALRKTLPIKPIEIVTESDGTILWKQIILSPVIRKGNKLRETDVELVAIGRLDGKTKSALTKEDMDRCRRYHIDFLPPILVQERSERAEQNFNDELDDEIVVDEVPDIDDLEEDDLEEGDCE